MAEKEDPHATGAVEMISTPYQQEVLEKLQDPNCPRRALVQAPTGTGVRRSVQIVIEEAARSGTVLVLAPTRGLVEQWASRLSDREGFTVEVVDSADTALRLAEDPTSRTGRVLLATYVRLAQGPSRRALVGMTLDLFVADEPLRGLPDTIRDLVAASRRTIAVASGPVDTTFSDLPTIASISLESAIVEGDLRVEEVSVHPAADERSLLDAAEALVERATRGAPLSPPVYRTRPWLHSVLLRIANGRAVEPVETPDGEAEAVTSDVAAQAWELLDRFDELGPDPRLQALDVVLARIFAAARGAVVITATVADAEYVHAHLMRRGFSEAGLLTGRSRRADWRILNEMGPGSTMVVTAVLSDVVEQLPQQVDFVTWSDSPERQAMRGRLASLLQFGAGRTVYLLSDLRN